MEQEGNTYDSAIELMEVAQVYLKDGAPETAADRLRQSADLCDAMAKRRAADFGL